MQPVDGAANDAPSGERKLLVHYPGETPRIRIEPGLRWRRWMNETNERFANRCLPLLMANEAGWIVLNPVPFEARWTGGDGAEAMTIKYDDGTIPEHRIAESHFGYGILTFNHGYIVRTPPGYNVLARGPANLPKDGISPLEGLIETDWALIPFTMNWKLTRPGSVAFAAEEPFCQLVPQRRGELESFWPELRSIEEDSDVLQRVKAWHGTRRLYRFAKGQLADAGDRGYRRLWLDDYFRGRTPSGESGAEHQTKLRLRPF